MNTACASCKKEIVISPDYYENHGKYCKTCISFLNRNLEEGVLKRKKRCLEREMKRQAQAQAQAHEETTKVD